MWKVRWCSSVKETTTRARATCCARCEECFVRHNDSGLDDSSLEPNEKNHVCGSATCARVWCSVHRKVVKDMEGPEDLCPGLQARSASRYSSHIQGLSLHFSRRFFFSAFSSLVLGSLTAGASICCRYLTGIDVDRGAPLGLCPLFASCLCQADGFNTVRHAMLASLGQLPVSASRLPFCAHHSRDPINMK